MKKRVYIETTIPSYYYEIRKDTKSRAWQEVTRNWWRNYRRYYEPITSQFVLYELSKSEHPNATLKIELVNTLEKLPHLLVIEDIVEEYIRHQLVPKEYGGDAFHLAYCSYYAIDFLMTWNCANLANPNKFHHIEVINTRLGLKSPILCTPDQLLSEGAML